MSEADGEKDKEREREKEKETEKEKERERERERLLEVEMESSMKEMVLSYLLTQCYGETAKAFVLGGRVKVEDLENQNDLEQQQQQLHFQQLQKGFLPKGKARAFEVDDGENFDMEIDQDDKTPNNSQKSGDNNNSNNPSKEKGQSKRMREDDFEERISSIDELASSTNTLTTTSSTNLVSLVNNSPTNGNASPNRSQPGGENGNENQNGKNSQLPEEAGLIEMETEDHENHDANVVKGIKNKTLSINDPAHIELMNRPEFGTMEDRKLLQELVLQGELTRVRAECESKFPGLLSIHGKYKDLFFMILSQQFIEMVRSKVPTDQVLKFAQTELALFGFQGGHYIEQLQDLVALTAYVDPQKSPVASYFSTSRRELIANLLNISILKFLNANVNESLERITKQTTIVSELLSNEAPNRYSKWQLKDLFEETC